METGRWKEDLERACFDREVGLNAKPINPNRNQPQDVFRESRPPAVLYLSDGNPV